MKCIFCQNVDTDVVETRISENGIAVRRRRECIQCLKRFTTYERAEKTPLMVIKRDGRRERFDRDKLIGGMIKASEKTKLTIDAIESIADKIEQELNQADSIEITSQSIGDLVAKELKKIDKVAYIRFSSVFRRFVDLEDFEKELKKLL